MSNDMKTDVSADAVTAKVTEGEIRKSGDLSDTDLANVTGGVKPWLDPSREPDTAIFYTTERKL